MPTFLDKIMTAEKKQPELTFLDKIMQAEPVTAQDYAKEGSTLTDIPKALVRGIDTVGAGLGGTMEMFGIGLGTDIKELYQKRAERPEIAKPQYLQEGTVVSHPERLADPRWWVNLVGENLPNMAMMMAPGAAGYGIAKGLGMGAKGVAAMATGGAMTGSFTIEAGSAYNDAKAEMLQMGYPVDQAESVATIEGSVVGTVNAILEVLPFNILLKNPGGKKLLARIVRQGLWEGGTEGVQENVNMLATQLGHKPDVKLKDWIGRTVESGLAGLALGGGAGVFEGSKILKEGEVDASTIYGDQGRGLPEKGVPVEETPSGEGLPRAPAEEVLRPGAGESGQDIYFQPQGPQPGGEAAKTWLNLRQIRRLKKLGYNYDTIFRLQTDQADELIKNKVTGLDFEKLTEAPEVEEEVKPKPVVPVTPEAEPVAHVEPVTPEPVVPEGKAPWAMTKAGDTIVTKNAWIESIESIPEYHIQNISDAADFMTKELGKSPSSSGRWSANLLTRETAPYATGGRGGAKFGVTNRGEAIHDVWAKTNKLDFVDDSADVFNIHNAFHEWLHTGKGKEVDIQRKSIDLTRKFFAKKYLSESKPVPSEVLADYPDLKPAAPIPVGETIKDGIRRVISKEFDKDRAEGFDSDVKAFTGRGMSEVEAVRNVLDMYRDWDKADKRLEVALKKDLDIHKAILAEDVLRGILEYRELTPKPAAPTPEPTPEYISGMALQTKDGKTISGETFGIEARTHADLWDRLSQEEKDNIKSDDGVVTNKGRYLTREQEVKRISDKTKSEIDRGTYGWDANQLINRPIEPVAPTPKPAAPEIKPSPSELQRKWFSLGREVSYEFPTGTGFRPTKEQYKTSAEKLGISNKDAERAYSVFASDGEVPANMPPDLKTVKPTPATPEKPTEKAAEPVVETIHRK